MTIDLDEVKRQIEESIPWRDGVLTVEQAYRLVDEVELLREEAVVARSCETWLTVEVERLKKNAEARERFLRREGNALRAAERERDDLRKKVERLRAVVADCEQSYRFAASKAQTLERQAVVAWLRETDGPDSNSDCEEAFTFAADAIERGDHRTNSVEGFPTQTTKEPECQE
jgi:hypothetical protein